LPFLTLPLLTLSMVGCRVGGPSEERDAGPDGVADGDVVADGDAETLGDAFPVVCTECHGSKPSGVDPGSPAPPVGLHGEVETTTRAVGAHQQHLVDADWHVRVRCDACHAVPRDVEDEGHIGMPPAELVWSALASARGVSPSFDGTRCNVYCHGVALLPGGSTTTPVWTQVDPINHTQTACGTCHGLPPDPPHPANSNCPTCHRDRFDHPTEFHINGVVDVSAMLCNSCHGSDVNDAPPIDTQGNSDTTAIGVGAHQSHLASSPWHRDTTCTDCHAVPATLDAPGHIDTALPAELTWSALATADGATPTFETATATCTGAYCHGATLSAGSNTAPVWTTVDGTQAACGACHGIPPGGGHPVRTLGECHLCHGDVIAADGSFVDRTLHVDGAVELSAAGCDTCHGSGGNPAPPVDLEGDSATTARGVGAHRSHVATGSTWHRDVPCSECHVVPSTIDAPGHLDATRPADLTWGPLATSGGAVPAFDGTRCSGVYCHGSTLGGGGTIPSPAWTTVDGTQAACGTCHALPPSAPHPSAANCYFCHPAVVDSTRAFVDPTLHINGRTDF
jgi:predicted CxxxxCH...CXXCH cytochrome family protein